MECLFLIFLSDYTILQYVITIVTTACVWYNEHMHLIYQTNTFVLDAGALNRAAIKISRGLLLFAWWYFVHIQIKVEDPIL